MMKKAQEMYYRISYCVFCPQVNLVAKCENLSQAVKFIEAEQPDLVFLDIGNAQLCGIRNCQFF